VRLLHVRVSTSVPKPDGSGPSGVLAGPALESIKAGKAYFGEVAPEVVEPRVLNGAQTIVTLHRFLYPKKGEPPGMEEVARLSEVRVLAKILYGCDEQFFPRSRKRRASRSRRN
jgi:hypothetical protein